MTRNELNTVVAMKDADIAPLSFINTTDMQKMVEQSNAKDVANALAQQQYDSRYAALQIQLDNTNKQLSDSQATIKQLNDVLGGTEAGIALIKQKTLEELNSQKQAAIDQQAAIEAKIVSLG